MFNTYYIKHKNYLNQIREDIDDAEKVVSKSGNINLKSFDLHSKLNDKIWDKDSNLKPGIREQLIQIAKDFYDTLDIAEITEEENPDKKPDETFDKYIKDVLFVGSLANYNYSSYADVDLHLLMDENKVVGKNKLALNILKKYFTECKNDWNLKHSDLNIEGYDCELYVQDIKEKNASNGVYSLFNDEWIKHPNPLETKNFDRDWVEKKALDYIEQIDSLEEVINSKSDLELIEKAKDELKKIKDKIVQGRRDSLAAGQGEMNSYNILFKILRRSGHIGKINDLTVSAYDLLNSIDNKNNLQKESKNMKTEVYITQFDGNYENPDFIEFSGNSLKFLDKFTIYDDPNYVRKLLNRYFPTVADNFTGKYNPYDFDEDHAVENDDFGDWEPNGVIEFDSEDAAKEFAIDFYGPKGYKYIVGPQSWKESKNKKIVESEVDAIIDFERLYGPKASKALKTYLAKRSKKSVDEILTSDEEFEKFSNWAYKHLNIDVYERFTKYDKGSFYKRTSELNKDPDQKDKRYSDVGDDTLYTYEVDKIGGDFDRNDTIDWDKQYRDTPENDDLSEESILVKEDGQSIIDNIKNILSSKWINPYECDIDVVPQKHPFVKKYSLDKAALIINNALDEYSITKNKNDFRNKVEEVAKDYCFVDVPSEIIDLYTVKLIALVNVQGESIQVLENEEEQKYKVKMFLGKIDDNQTIIVTTNEPEENANKVLKKFNGEKWTKDSEYNYWYFKAQKNIDAIKTEMDKNFGNMFSVEIQNKEVQEDVKQPINNENPNKIEENSPKITGSFWDEFLKNIEENSIYKVDAAFKRHPNQWIELIDDTGKIYDAEVTKYSDGVFELQYSNIHPVPNTEESKKKTPINESYSDDMIYNIKNVLKKYFEVDPETNEENSQYDENFTAQEAIDEIVDILY